MNSFRRHAYLRYSILGLLLSGWAAGHLTSTWGDSDKIDSTRTSYAVEKEQLRRWRNRFNNLSAEHQSRLQEIHHAVVSGDNSQRLFMVMTRYTDWMKSLPSAQRAELMELEPSQRVAEIKRLREEETKHLSTEPPSRFAVRQPLRDDMQNILHWFRTVYVPNHKHEFLARMPPWLQQRMQNSAETRRKISPLILRHITEQMQTNSWPTPTTAEFQKLNRLLSPDAVDQLREMSDDRARTKLLRGWIGLAMGDSGSQRRLDPRQLERFHAGLNEEQRQRLNRLSTEHAHHELIRMFDAQTEGRRPQGSGFPPEGPGDGQLDRRRRGRRGPGPPYAPKTRGEKRPDRAPRKNGPKTNDTALTPSQSFNGGI